MRLTSQCAVREKRCFFALLFIKVGQLETTPAVRRKNAPFENRLIH